MFDNEDDSSEESLSKQVLPIADDRSEPIDLSRPPATGEEYLRQVRYDDEFRFLVREWMRSVRRHIVFFSR